jgi:hypothetical protein
MSDSADGLNILKKAVTYQSASLENLSMDTAPEAFSQEVKRPESEADTSI